MAVQTDGLTSMLPYVIQYDHRGKILHRACFNRNTLDNGLFCGGVRGSELSVRQGRVILKLKWPVVNIVLCFSPQYIFCSKIVKFYTKEAQTN